MERAGAELVKAGHTIVSGNAPGADQAFARGGNSIDVTKVEVCLPWDGFEAHAVRIGNVVRVYGSSGTRQSPTALLHGRNGWIVGDVKAVLAYLPPWGGGTLNAVRQARLRKTPVHNVRWPKVRAAFDEAAVNGAIFP